MPKKSSFSVPITDFLIYQHAHIIRAFYADVLHPEPYYLVLLYADKLTHWWDRLEL